MPIYRLWRQADDKTFEEDARDDEDALVVFGLRLFQFLLQVFAQRATCAQLTVWMTAPLLIQLANEFSVVGLGRANLPAPFAWFTNVLNELILFSNVLQTVL